MALDHVIFPRLHLFNNMKDLIFYVCIKENKTVAGRMEILLSSLWNNRNNLVWIE
jgi:hypothetical protein